MLCAMELQSRGKNLAWKNSYDNSKALDILATLPETMRLCFAAELSEKEQRIVKLNIH